MDKNTDPAANADLARLGQEWISHARAASDFWTRKADAQRAGRAALGFETECQADHHAQSWAQLATSPLARSLYAMDLTDGERALARSLGTPFSVANILAPSAGTEIAARRRDARAQELGKALHLLALFGSTSASSVFPQDPPFCGHGPSERAAKMRAGRVAHCSALFGSIAALSAGAAAHSIVPAAGMPAFTALTIASAACASFAYALSALNKAPEQFTSARIIRMVWPELSSKAAFGYQNKLSYSGLDEFSAASPNTRDPKDAALANVRSNTLEEDSADYSPELARWIAPMEAAMERAALGDDLASQACRAQTSTKLRI